MSLVYITHHDENIFDVEREPGDSSGRGPRSQRHVFAKHSNAKSAQFAKSLRDRLNIEYKKHQMIVQQDGQLLLTDAKKCDHRTMGCAKARIDPPCAYLRKNGGVKWRRENNHVCPKGPGVPPLPPRAPTVDRQGMFPNFVRRNIKCAGSTVACPPPPRYVDTPVGTRHNLLNSGLVPQFICRRDYGRVPNYIQVFKRDDAFQKEHCKCAAFSGQKTGLPAQMAGVRTMDFPERQEILQGLKQHLSEMTKQYQSMSLLIDSVAKRQRKGKLETDLRQVEQDILLIETSPIIYVSQY